jgi:hypothetical protein
MENEFSMGNIFFNQENRYYYFEARGEKTIVLRGGQDLYKEVAKVVPLLSRMVYITSPNSYIIFNNGFG